MRIIILGASGMLGHVLMRFFSQNNDVIGTTREKIPYGIRKRLMPNSKVIDGISVNRFDRISSLVSEWKPDAVINCIGIVKQLEGCIGTDEFIEVNALFPHKVAKLCEADSIKLVHISTDCVFSGQRGNYIESDVADAMDIYGKTKYLGEIAGNNIMTIRTSMVGREISSSHGIVEWLISNKGGRVKGFGHSYFSGFTTNELAKILNAIIRRPEIGGLWHLSADPISKFDLLCLLNQKLKLDITIDLDETTKCDRTLNGTRFEEEFNYHPPKWCKMVSELADETQLYDAIRGGR
jgi:dTDP-4-dehydrorhamnose reductase